MGSRIPGSEGNRAARNLITSELQSNWNVSLQIFTPEEPWNSDSVELANIIAERNSDSSAEWIILGAHYDTRRFADSDPDPTNRMLPVPGANDGASGVAVLLELAHAIVEHDLAGIRLAFFDGEDQGRLGGWPWIVGSSHYVSQLSNKSSIQAVIILDMIGDSDLQIFKERNSFRENAALVDSFWEVAASLGYNTVFVPEEKYSIVDDHTPFLAQEIPALDLIDFDYPYWHTTNDTIDKISPDSLGIVGKTVELWLLQGNSVFYATKSKKTPISTFWILAAMLAPSISGLFRKYDNPSKHNSCKDHP
ncbi:MAG: M28 family peptidase [Candidatus Heimdallarchaeota archaeon]